MDHQIIGNPDRGSVSFTLAAGDSVIVSQDLIGSGPIRYFGLSGTVATSGTSRPSYSKYKPPPPVTLPG